MFASRKISVQKLPLIFNLHVLSNKGESRVGIKPVKINISRRGDSITHSQHMVLWRSVCN